MSEAYLVLYDEPDGTVRLGVDYGDTYSDQSHAHKCARALAATMGKMCVQQPDEQSEQAAR